MMKAYVKATPAGKKRMHGGDTHSEGFSGHGKVGTTKARTSVKKRGKIKTHTCSDGGQSRCSLQWEGLCAPQQGLHSHMDRLVLG